MFEKFQSYQNISEILPIIIFFSKKTNNFRNNSEYSDFEFVYFKSGLESGQVLVGPPTGPGLRHSQKLELKKLI